LPPMTFAATANCVAFQGGTPVFADVEQDTLLINPDEVEKKITKKTRAIVAVDYAGQPCEYDSLLSIAENHGLKLVSDGCHALGAEYKNRKVGTLADLTVFSFHPVKHITTGEGGAILTDDEESADRMRLFRNHCINADFGERRIHRSWFYEIVDLGHNYRLSDIHCALGISQMKKIERFLLRRAEIAAGYNNALAPMPEISPLTVRDEVIHAYHLYVVRLESETYGLDRTEVFRALHKAGIGVNVHYIPVHLHPYYRRKFGCEEGLCPVAEASYENILSLPIFPAMTDDDVNSVIRSIKEVLKKSSG
jgi:perosamine synthetase